MLQFSLNDLVCTKGGTSQARELTRAFAQYLAYIAEEHNIEPYAHSTITQYTEGNGGTAFWNVRFHFVWHFNNREEWPVKITGKLEPLRIAA